MKKRRKSCAVVVVERRVLAITYGKKLHDWALPGGGVDPGETDVEGAIRELAEETGVRVRHDAELIEVRFDEVTQIRTIFAVDGPVLLPAVLRSEPFEGYVAFKGFASETRLWSEAELGDRP